MQLGKDNFTRDEITRNVNNVKKMKLIMKTFGGNRK